MVERNEDNIYKVSLFGYVVFLKKIENIYFCNRIINGLVIEDICFRINSLEMSNR